MLRILRITAALLFFSLLTFYFLDFAEIAPHSFHRLAHLQFVPALLSLSLIILAALLALTLLLGRVYCSVICPLGVFQDIISWIARHTLRRKKRYTFSKAKTLLRYSVLAGVVVAFIGGLTSVLALLDPYSLFGRIAVNVFRPVYLMGNNLLEILFIRFHNYTFYKMDTGIFSISSFVIALLTLVAVAGLAWKYGRTWCNTICPVGTVLGFLSNYSLFKIRINPDKCNHCKKCVTKCKASCIDSKEQKVDHNRCVACFDCLGACKQKALTYSLPRFRSHDGSQEASPLSKEEQASRRQFLSLTAVAATASLTPKLFAQENRNQAIAAAHGVKAFKRIHPITPPGSISREHFSERCTSCHLCVSKCPSRVLKPAFMEYGLGGLMQPTVQFEKGFCNFDCTLCTEICPNGALLPLTKEQKHLTQIGYVVLIKENCIVYRDGTSCGACSEHCPTQAIAMIPYQDGLTVPQINTEICVGCGGCEYVCPALPFRAVYIEGNPQHKKAKPFVDQENHDIEIDGFGF